MNPKQSIRKKLFMWILELIVALGVFAAITYGFAMFRAWDLKNQLFMSIISNHAKDVEVQLNTLMQLQGPLLMMNDETFAAWVQVSPDTRKRYEQTRKDIEKSIGVLSESIQSKRDRALVDKIKKTYNQYKKDSKAAMNPEGDENASTTYDAAELLVKHIKTMKDAIEQIGKNNRVMESELRKQVHFTIVWICGSVIILGGVAFILTIWVTNVITKNIALPLNAAVNFALDLAEGDLTHEVKFHANRLVRPQSEIGHLCSVLNKMAGNIRNMLSEVNNSTLRVNDGSTHISRFTETIIRGTDEQSRAVTDASDSVKMLTSEIDSIAENSKVMSSAVKETTSSIDLLVDAVSSIDESVTDLTSQVSNSMAVITEMSASTAQVNKSAKVMADSVQETSSTIQEMLASVEEVSLNARDMDTSVETASGIVAEMLSSFSDMTTTIKSMNNSLVDAIGQIDSLITSVGAVSSDAREVAQASEETSRTAESGGQLIKQTIEGMKTIKVTVSDTARKIRELGESSAQIGNIISTIREIADQTNLLALNAAIEAARAGEEGRGFNVVAQNIKKLAERSTEATKDIEKLIRNIQRETDKVVIAMDEGVKEVQKGTGLADRAGEALTDIVTSISRTTRMMQQIYNATSNQTVTSEKVRQVMTSLTGESKAVTEVTKRQQKDTIDVRDAFEKIRTMALQVKNSTSEQKAAGRQISQAIETLSGIALQLTTAIEEQEKGTNQMVITMENINTRAQDIQEATGRQRSEGDVIRRQIVKMRDFTSQVAEATARQSQSSHMIVEKMSSIGRIAEANSENSSDVRLRAENLAEAVDILEKMISRFTIAENGHAGGGLSKGLALVEEEV